MKKLLFYVKDLKKDDNNICELELSPGDIDIISKKLNESTIGRKLLGDLLDLNEDDFYEDLD